jgi:hypothetical protein
MGVWFCDACRTKPKNRRKIARLTSGRSNRRSNGDPRSAVALVRSGTDEGAGGGGAIGPGADDDIEADDERVYCWCQTESYGVMVACDDNDCEREWASLSLFSGSESLGSRADITYSSTWSVSDSMWPPKVCGFVMRVG